MTRNMLTDCNDSFHSYRFDLSVIQTARTCISFEFISSVRLFIFIKCIFTEAKMSKKEKSLHEKMKNFFARKDTPPLNFEGMNVEPYVVSYEIMKDISSENNVNHRIKSLKDLYEHVVSKLLAQNVVEAICKQIEDLLSPNQSLETRHIVFQFFNGLIISQLDNLYIMRSYFFKLIVTHKIPSDLMPRFEMLKALSQDGKQIKYFEEEIGPFLLSWFPDFVAIEKEAEFLALLVNVISYNAAYLDEVIIHSFINYINQLCSRSKKQEDIEESLKVLGAVVMFSHLPKLSLHKFICTLCITVNHEKFVSHSWEKMRYILGTYIGHTVIRYLCVVLEDINHHPDSRIIRGAVYFIGMALWGPNRVSSLTHPPAAIIPAFLKAVDRNSDIIAYEIILALKKLILDCGNQLVNRSLVWDDILEVVKRILLYPEFQGVSPSFSTYFQTVHNLITTLEEHCPEDSHENLYKMIDQCSLFRSEQSILRLISFKEQKLKGYKPEFITVFTEFIEKYFKKENRSAIQLEVLKVIQRIRPKCLYYVEADTIDQIILQNLSHLVTVPDVNVRKEAVKLLITMAEMENPFHCFEILDIIEKLMNRLTNSLKLNDSLVEPSSDVVTAVEGLINIFKQLYDIHSAHCIEIFYLFVHHLHEQYKCPHYEEGLIKIRKMILEFFLQMRANKHGHIGILSQNEVNYCLFIKCPVRNNHINEGTPPRERPAPSTLLPVSPSSAAPVYEMDFYKALEIVATCVREERDWNILEMVFRELPLLLKNKALILCSKKSLITLGKALCKKILEKTNGLPGILKNAPSHLTRTDVHCQMFSCAIAFICYSSTIDTFTQKLLNNSLQTGLVSRSAKICMEGLTLCLMEMQDSMVTLLPKLLLNLSKMSATKLVAVPVLEFLSNLIRLPNLYISFVEDQYMSIFAIALPYTNPFKFNQYTVALAHHVLSMWFLKCRIPFRREFAKFILKGLRNNLNVPHEQIQKEESSSEMSTSAILALHTELMETGLDLMARFTFGMCTNVPQRCPIAEFLLEKGQKGSWLVGNKIITITTSGCGTKSFKNGLCELCYSSSHEKSKNVDTDQFISMEPDSSDSGPEKFSSQRKRHRSAIQRTNTIASSEILSSSNQSKDDITLHYKRDKGMDLSHRRHTSFDPETGLSKFSFDADEKDKEKDSKGNQLCSCWCNSWAEVHIRRPTGSTSWMMRIQNQLLHPSVPEVPLSLLRSLILPHTEENEDHIIEEPPTPESDRLSLIESECAIEISSSQKSTPPMRRTNSSPDMSTGWLQSLGSGKYPASEGSEIIDSDHAELQQQVNELELMQSYEKQDSNEKVKSKNLKLDLNSNKDRSSSAQIGVRTEKKVITTAPIEKKYYGNEAEQQSVSGSFRDRGHTISVMSPSRPTDSENSALVPEVSHRSGMSPSFVFLQLFHNGSFGTSTSKPILLQQTEQNNRAIHVLDHIPPYDTHKIGVVYVGSGQADNEVAILSNIFGSARYVEFLQGLGTIVSLADIDPKKTYLGGLETNGADGILGLIWHDDVMQVVFHVATFMKNKASDEMRNEKKKHVANDSVMIIYNESGEEFKTSTIKGQVTNAWIIIKPEEYDCNVVSVKHRSKELIDMFEHTESYVVSDKSLSVFVRQLALHANLASLIINRNKQSTAKFSQVSNWLERLRTIKRLRFKILEDLKKKNKSENFEFESDTNDYDDFTDYV